MSCSNKKCSNNCKFNIKTFGTCDASRITLDGSDPTVLNWSEISIPEIMPVPTPKPNIEHLDQVYVNAKLNNVKLIETPFAYQSYERAATALEIAAASAALAVSVIDITPVIDLVDGILEIEDLPVIPEVAALQVALAAVNTAAANLIAAIAAANTAIALPCVGAALLVTLLEAVRLALIALNVALTALLAAANALVVATADIPVVGDAVEDEVELLIAAVNTVFADITAAITAIIDVITLVGPTNVFVIIPNAEGACLSGRKLVVEGKISQKVVYTGLVATQSVHSMHSTVPFSAYIIAYPSFVGLTFTEDIVVLGPPETPCITVSGYLYNPANPIVPNLCEEFRVDSCIEDIFAYPVDERNVFKNITLFLSARPVGSC